MYFREVCVTVVNMRSDMHKLITTPGRWGSERGHREIRHKKASKYHLEVWEDEDGTLHTEAIPHRKGRGMRPRGRAVDRKTFSDHLGPLRRFLLSRVGRRWDDVYSEIVEKVPKGLHRHHLDTHLESYVEIKPSVGRYFVWADFFVDDKGFLRRHKKTPRKKTPTPEEDAGFKWVSKAKLTAYVKCKGIWYLCKIEERKPKLIPFSYFCYQDTEETWRFYGKVWRISEVLKQLNSKELRRARLKND